MSAVSVSESGVRPILAEAVDLARRALSELQPTGVGEHLGVTAEDECAATHHFAATLPGYAGWQWAVVVAAPPEAEYATVSESALLPGPDALVAPDFVPWDQRVRPGDLAPGDLLAPQPDDPRLVPGYLITGDPVVDEVAEEIGLGRSRVLSREGRVEAAERWYTEYGPDTDMARAAPATCGVCGFFVPLAGALRAAFGVCSNAMGADGHVVHAEYGCGAHSDTVLPTGGGSPLYEAYDDAAVEIVPAAQLRPTPEQQPAESGRVEDADSGHDEPSGDVARSGFVESGRAEREEAGSVQNGIAQGDSVAGVESPAVAESSIAGESPDIAPAADTREAAESAVAAGAADEGESENRASSVTGASPVETTGEAASTVVDPADAAADTSAAVTGDRPETGREPGLEADAQASLSATDEPRPAQSTDAATASEATEPQPSTVASPEVAETVPDNAAGSDVANPQSISHNATEASAGDEASKDPDASTDAEASPSAEVSAATEASASAEESAGAEASQVAEVSAGAEASQVAEMSSGAEASPGVEISAGAETSADVGAEATPDAGAAESETAATDTAATDNSTGEAPTASLDAAARNTDAVDDAVRADSAAGVSDPSPATPEPTAPLSTTDDAAGTDRSVISDTAESAADNSVVAESAEVDDEVVASEVANGIAPPGESDTAESTTAVDGAAEPVSADDGLAGSASAADAPAKSVVVDDGAAGTMAADEDAPASASDTAESAAADDVTAGSGAVGEVAEAVAEVGAVVSEVREGEESGGARDAGQYSDGWGVSAVRVEHGESGSAGER